MESVTIPVVKRRNQKRAARPPTTGVEDEAAVEAVEPARPPTPTAAEEEEAAVEAVEPPCPPTPTAAEEEEVAVCVEPACPPTPTGVEEVDPAAEGSVQPNILQEGWNLLKRYLADEVGAAVVSEYLETVKDTVAKADLETGFSEVMSCKDDERRIILEEMIEAKLGQSSRFSSNHLHYTYQTLT